MNMIRKIGQYNRYNMLVVYCVSWLIITIVTVNGQLWDSDKPAPTEADLLITGQTCVYNKGRAGYVNETFVYLDRDDVPEKDVINFAGVFDFRSRHNTMHFQGKFDLSLFILDIGCIVDCTWRNN